MDRQEGYYWVKNKYGFFIIAHWDGYSWYLIMDDEPYKDQDFKHINEVRIKEPGELPEL